MSQVLVAEGRQHVHRGDITIWAIDVSAVTTDPIIFGTAQVYDDTAGGGNVTADLIFSGTQTASGTNINLPQLGGTLGTGWEVGHMYRVTATFRDTATGAYFVRGIQIQVDF